MEFNKLTIEELKECIVKGRIKLSNGNVRKFDLLDFFLMSNYQPSTFLRMVKKTAKSSEYDKVRTFFAIFETGKSYVRHASANELVSIDYSYKGYRLDEDEKFHIIKFLNDNAIPINEATYFYASRKYVDGIIDIYENRKSKPKTKTRKKLNNM